MYAVLNMNYKPKEFAELPPKEKAFVIAAIAIKQEQEEKMRKKMNTKSVSVKRRR